MDDDLVYVMQAGYTPEMRVLPASFYRHDSVDVAREIIGKLIVRSVGTDVLIGRIVETEAYRPDDPASHSFRGLTPRTAPMFEHGGISYVYFIYGMYDCFNVVTDQKGRGSAVLIRALQPVSGIHAMWRNRFADRPLPDIPDALEVHTGYPAAHVLRLISSLTNGPGKLARALAISAVHDTGKSLQTGDITIQDDDFRPENVLQDTRIGISVGTEHQWRFYLADSPFVSRRQGESRSMMRSRSSREK